MPQSQVREVRYGPDGFPEAELVDRTVIGLAELSDRAEELGYLPIRDDEGQVVGYATASE